MNNSRITQFSRKNNCSVNQKVPEDIRRTASSLMFMLNIPNGNALVKLIGKGREYSNQRAIETWLMERTVPNQPIEELGDALINKLESMKTMEVC